MRPCPLRPLASLLLHALLGLLLASCTGSSPTPQAETSAPAPPTAPSNIFHVAPDGNDSAPGTAEDPWRTIQHAADVLPPGGGVLVHAGTYHEAVTLTRSGEPGGRITFAAAPGEMVVLDGRGGLDSAFQTASDEPDPQVSHITIMGFTIRNYASFGIVAWSRNDALVLRDLVVLDNGDAGIRLSNSDGSLVQNVQLRGNMGGFDCTPILPGREDDPGCTTLVIRDVAAVDNGPQGDNTAMDAFAVEHGSGVVIDRSLASGGPGDGFDIKADNAHLRQVVAHNTRNNIKLWGQNSTVTNALAYDATADANLVLTAGGSYTITNVTIANMTSTAYLVVVGDPSGRGSTPVWIRNSILANEDPANAGTLLWIGPEVDLRELSHTLLFNPYRTEDIICADPPPFSGRCYSVDDLNAGAWPFPAVRVADPLFLDPAEKDFHLHSGSPAIDAGTPAGAPSVDVDGQPRDSQPDLGAYEVGGG